jgi:cytochrome b
MSQTDPDATRLWDLPTRLFHWLLVTLVLAAWLTARYGLMAWHMRCGAVLLSLVGFRIAWGTFGSTTARFAGFVRGPRALLEYLRALWRGAPPHVAGHNPAGGLMVVALLLLLCAQLATGLCANDDLHANGPFALAIGKIWSDRLTRLHSQLFDVLAACAWAHVVAIGYYGLVLRDNLVLPMLGGRRAGLAAQDPPLRFVHPAWALLCWAAALLGAMFLFRGN